MTRRAPLPPDWPTLGILPVHWLSVREKADSMGKRLSGACSSDASCDSRAMLFPGEPRANFRRRDLAAELGTPGRLWAVCIPGAGPATRAAELRNRARCSRRQWPPPRDRGRRGRALLGSAVGGVACARVARQPPLSSAQARLLGSERGAPARSAFPPAASCRATLVSPWPCASGAFSSVTGG